MELEISYSKILANLNEVTEEQLGFVLTLGEFPFLNHIPHGGGGGGKGQILPALRLPSLQLLLKMQQNHRIW